MSQYLLKIIIRKITPVKFWLFLFFVDTLKHDQRKKAGVKSHQDIRIK